jgi:hypothetical protein
MDKKNTLGRRWNRLFETHILFLRKIIVSRPAITVDAIDIFENENFDIVPWWKYAGMSGLETSLKWKRKISGSMIMIKKWGIHHGGSDRF